MLRPFVSNRYLDAVIKLMLLSAAFHMVLLFCLAVKNSDLETMNFFNILDIDLIFPGVMTFPYHNIIAFAAALGIYMAIFFFNKKPR